MVDEQVLRRHKDALVSALFSLSRAAGEASNATIDLINFLQEAGHDTTALNNAFRGISATSSLVSAVELDEQAPSDASQVKQLKSTDAQTESTDAQTEPAEASSSAKEVAADAADASIQKPKEKKERPPRDPNAPRRPLPTQLVWINEQRRLVKEDREKKSLPPLSREEMREMLGSRWNNLAAPVRETYERTHKEAMQKYHHDVQIYNAAKGITAEANAADSQETANASQSSPKKTKDPKSKDPKPTSEAKETVDKSPGKRKKHREDKDKRHKKDSA